MGGRADGERRGLDLTAHSVVQGHGLGLPWGLLEHGGSQGHPPPHSTPGATAQQVLQVIRKWLMLEKKG